MTHLRLALLAFGFMLGLCFAPAQAQQNQSTNSAGNDVLREKAFALLESVAGQISALQSAENRARLGSNIADSLWDHDEKRARALLVSVQDDINAGLRNNPTGRPADERERLVFVQLRINTVERIARHDGVLALSFLESTQPSMEGAQSSEQLQRAVETERAFELRLAKEIAARNPEIALNIARRSLDRGFFGDVLPLLGILNRKHKEEARILTAEIVARLSRVNLGQDMATFYFAESLARRFAPPVMDVAVFRDLIAVFVNSAAANGCNNKMDDNDERAEFCGRIGSILPLIQKVDPAHAANLKRWETEEGYQEASYSGYEELNEVSQDGTVDEILALATKYPQMEESIYWSAIQKAQASGDLERARRLATDYNGNPAMRQSMLEMVDRYQKFATEIRAKLKELQATIDSLPDIKDRIGLLMYAAGQVEASDQKEAFKLMEQANGMIDGMKPGKDQLEAQVTLAVMYCSAGSARGLSIMQSLMPKLNELVRAAATLDGYENDYLRDGEWNMSQVGLLGSLLTKLSENASHFAWCDFDRAVSVAGEFERPEIRLMAELKLAQGILAGPRKPFGWIGPMRWN